MHDTRDPDPAVARSRDVNVRGVLLFGFWLLVGSIAAVVAMFGLFRMLEKGQERSDKLLPPQVAVSLQRTPPEPRLEPDPLALRRELHAAEDAQLKSYGWVDRPSGVVRIPIARAMELLLERGVPGGKPMPAGTAPASQAAGQK